MPYLIVDDMTQSVIDGPYPSRADAEQALLRIGLDSAYIAESPAPESPSRPGAEQIEALRRRWRHIAGGHWVAAYNALRRRDFAAMRREADAAKDARAHADPMVGSVFGPPPAPPRSLERYEEAGARYERDIPRLVGAVSAEIRSHEAWRQEMRIWEREARRRGGDPRQLFHDFHRVADALPAAGAMVSVLLRPAARGTHHEAELDGAKLLVYVPFEQRLAPRQRRRAVVELREHSSPPDHHRAANWVRWEDES
jgi:hypothetical protein